MKESLYDVEVDFKIRVPTEARTTKEAKMLALNALEYIYENIIDIGFDFEVKVGGIKNV